jgi:hypothetical protein
VKYHVTTLVLLALTAVVAASAPARAARPSTPGGAELFRYASGEVVESVLSPAGKFRVHFTRAGAHAVPLTDANTNGTPDYVEEVAQLYDEALALYVSLGFRAPVPDGSVSGDHGPDALPDVYLLDFGGQSDGSFRTETCDSAGACTGYMVHENDFAGYNYPTTTIGNRILSSHELFHAVQAAYSTTQGQVFGEGTAVWATERFDPTLADLESFVPGYLMRPDRTLNLPLPGPVDPFSYGSAIWFQFLSERFGDAVIRELWEASAGDQEGIWFSKLDPVLAGHQSTFADAFFEFARWNLFTQLRADATQSYKNGRGYSLVRIDKETIPVKAMSLRLFPAATTYLGMAPDGRGMVKAHLVRPEGAAALRMALAVRKGNVMGKPVVATDDSATVDATGADQVIVLLVNTAQSGESLRPGLCVGSPEEADACKNELAPPPMMPPPMMAGGCAVVGHHPTGGPFALLFVVALAMLRWRRGGLRCARRGSSSPVSSRR